MTLNDFFSPITIEVIFKSIIFFLLLDIIGHGIAVRFNFPKWLRLFYWVFGLAILVFTWFCLHFFIPFDSNLIWASLLMIALIDLKTYYLRRGIYSLFKEIIIFPLPLLFLYPVIKSLIISLSLPPHVWDEMAYHYISPYQLLNEQKWVFTSPLYPNSLYLYQMVPRLLDTAYSIGFSLTHTYILSRLIHFVIFLSGIFTIGNYLKNKLGYFSAIIFIFFSYYLTPSLFSASTTGYIDVGAATILIVMLLISIEFILKPSKGKFYSYSAMAGIALGIKYTTIGFVIANISTITFFLIFSDKKNKYLKNLDTKRLISKYFLRFIIIVSIFGGYWYLKNLVLSGNPIYPFLFSCWKKFDCLESTNFFGNWALKFNFENFDEIKKLLFINNDNLFKLTIYSFFIALYYSKVEKNKHLFYIPVVTVVSFIFEIVYSAPISGYIPRYFYHWSIYIVIFLSLPLRVLFKKQKNLFFLSTIVFNLMIHLYLISPWEISQINIKGLNDPEFITSEKRSFIRNNISIEDWIRIKFPKMNNIIINVCGKPTLLKINVADSNLIWTSSEGLMRIFMVNCDFEILSYKPNLTVEEYYTELKAAKTGQYFISHAECGDINEYINDPKISYYFDLNQKIICDSKIIKPNLYYFESTNK